MARPETSRVRGGVLLCAFVSLALAACSSSNGTPNDSGSDGADAKARIDTGGGDAKNDVSADQTVDHSNTDTGHDATDTGNDATDTGADHGPGGATGSGGATGAGGATTTDGAAGMGGASATGGATGTGGVAGAGAGGADAGVDAQPDSPVTDSGPTDVAPDSPATDMSSDTTPACGTGCPSTIQSSHLALWLAADFGVNCMQGRVAAWQNRGNVSETVAPVSGKSGPQCGVEQIAGRAALFFDRPNADDTDGVLTVDLNSILSGSDYTVFVVERRQTDTEGYILGTTGNSTSCDDLPDIAYRFGYDPAYTPMSFVAGPYSTDPVQGGCIDPISQYATYSPTAPAALDVEVFDQTVGHELAINSVVVDHNTEMTPIDSLPAAYIGRAFNALNLGARHSRYLGDVGEIVIYNAALSDGDRALVEGYLKQRWNTP